MKADFIAHSDGRLTGPDGYSVRCALGRGGVVPGDEKREGDGGSPIGEWPVRRVFYRPDRIDKPRTALACIALEPFDGWCDDPAHPDYNTWVKLPFTASHEKLWMDSHVYDIIVELGYNDDPIVPGRGSAIFMHIATPDFDPTAGCVALTKENLLYVLTQLEPGSAIAITDQP